MYSVIFEGLWNTYEKCIKECMKPTAWKFTTRSIVKTKALSHCREEDKGSLGMYPVQ